MSHWPRDHKIKIFSFYGFKKWKEKKAKQKWVSFTTFWYNYFLNSFHLSFFTFYNFGVFFIIIWITTATGKGKRNNLRFLTAGRKIPLNFLRHLKCVFLRKVRDYPGFIYVPFLENSNLFDPFVRDMQVDEIMTLLGAGIFEIWIFYLSRVELFYGFGENWDILGHSLKIEVFFGIFWAFWGILN